MAAWSSARTGWTIFLVALAVRLAYLVLWRWGLPNEIDGAELERVALNLAEGRGFTSPFPPYLQPTAWFGPVVPGIWWLVFELTSGSSPSAFVTIVTLQAIVSSATVTVLWLAGRRIGAALGVSPRTSIILAAVLICWPASLTWLDQTWYAHWQELLLALLVLAGMRWFDAPGLRHALELGLVAGITALVNPSPFPVAAFAFLGPFVLRRHRRLSVLRVACAGALLSAAIIAPWIARNYRVFGEFIPVRGNLGIELRVANGPQGFVRLTGSAPHPWVSERERQRYNAIGERAYATEARDSARAYMRENPGRTALRAAARAYVFWFGDITGRWAWRAGGARWGTSTWRPATIRVTRIACRIVAMALCIAGLVTIVRGHERLPYAHLLFAVLVLMPLPLYITPISDSKSYFAQGWLIVIGLTTLASAGRRGTGGAVQMAQRTAVQG